MASSVAWEQLTGHVPALPTALPTRPISDEESLARYRQWMAAHEPSAAELVPEAAARWDSQPFISLVVPSPGSCTAALIDSIRRQTYPRWELLHGREEIGDPATRANDAVARATGDYVAALEAGDVLPPFALAAVASSLAVDAEVDVLYSDEDWLHPSSGERVDPFFKPAWSPDLLRSFDYLGRLTLVRRSLAAANGGARTGLGSAWEHDWKLRICEQARAIVHLPRVLCHRRTRPDIVLDPRHPRGRDPLVSIVIPNRDRPELLAACIAGIDRSGYSRREIVIVENGSRRQRTFDLYRSLERRKDLAILGFDRSFNYAALHNWAVPQTRGEVLLFLNNDVEPLDDDWLVRMLEHAVRDEVGAVGAKLLYPDGTVQHGGVILGLAGVAAHAHRGIRGDAPGNRLRALATMNVSAVTAACLMMRREVFGSVGGFDERFAADFNDVDLCLRVSETGRLVVWLAAARLMHHEAKTFGPRGVTVADRARFAREVALFREKWATRIAAGDPYFNPNLSLARCDFSPDPERPPPLPRLTLTTPGRVFQVAGPATTREHGNGPAMISSSA